MPEPAPKPAFKVVVLEVVPEVVLPGAVPGAVPRPALLKVVLLRVKNEEGSSFKLLLKKTFNYS